MIKICDRISIQEETFEEVEQAMKMCKNCKWYYNCEEQMNLNEKLLNLEENI